MLPCQVAGCEFFWAPCEGGARPGGVGPFGVTCMGEDEENGGVSVSISFQDFWSEDISAIEGPWKSLQEGN